jgi:toxin ParE1/3/4
MRDRRRRVVWAEAAVRDLEELAAFIATDSPVNAEHLLRRLWVNAESLRRNPNQGRLVPELLRFGMRTWRELVVRPYRLVYRVGSDAVVVLAVFDGRRDLEDVLLDRLVRSP